MYARPLLFGMVGGREVPVAAQAVARESYRKARSQDRFWIESDFMMPLGSDMLKTVNAMLDLSPKISLTCPAQYLALAQSGMCLAPDTSHVVREAMRGRPCVFSGHVDQSKEITSSTQLSNLEVDEGDGLVVFDVAWLKEAELPPLTNWRSLWDFARRIGGRMPSTVAYRDHAAA